MMSVTLPRSTLSKQRNIFTRYSKASQPSQDLLEENLKMLLSDKATSYKLLV